MRVHSTKRSITLIELLLCMTLIAIGLAALSWQVSKSLKTEQFERGVEQIFNTITLAQEIMLDFQTDVKLTLQQGLGEIYSDLEANCQLPKHIEKGLNRHRTIKGIEQMTFNHQKCQKIEIQFESVTGAISKGRLAFKYKNLEATTYLQGFPTTVKRGRDCEAL